MLLQIIPGFCRVPLGSRFSSFCRVPLGSRFSGFRRVPLGSRFSGFCRVSLGSQVPVFRYAHLFFFQKQSLNIFPETAARSLKNTEMFLEAATHSLKSKRYIPKQLLIFFHGFCTIISFRSSRTFFKKQEIYSEAATHLLKHKNNIQKQLHKSSRFLHKIYTLCVKIFHNL